MIKLSSLVFRIEKETVENFSSDSILNAFVGYQIRKRGKLKDINKKTRGDLKKKFKRRVARIKSYDNHTNKIIMFKKFQKNKSGLN